VNGECGNTPKERRILIFEGFTALRSFRGSEANQTVTGDTLFLQALEPAISHT
jgi:hypothetical protein